MGVFFENFGLKEDFFDDDNLIKFINWSLHTGRMIEGYYGIPYINRGFGWPEIMCKLERNEDGKLEFSSLDTHCSGTSYWDVVVAKPQKGFFHDPSLDRRIVVSKPDHRGFAVINVVNADVLPTFAPEEKLTLQMIAFPISVNYYLDEDSFCAAQRLDDDDEIVLEDGVMFPYGMLLNSKRIRENEEHNKEDENLMLIRGTVKKCETGRMLLPSEEGAVEHNTFVDIYIDTEFGPLEIIHSPEMVDEEERKYMEEGSIIYCLAYLSGDAAVMEYEDGFVKDHENNLKVLAYSHWYGDAERLRSVLTDKTEYYSETIQEKFVGADEIIARIKYVKDNRIYEIDSKTATITGYNGDGEPEYPVGTRCVSLSYPEAPDARGLLFIEEDSDNNISCIYLSNDQEYEIEVDNYYTDDEPDLFDDDRDSMEIIEELFNAAENDDFSEVEEFVEEESEYDDEIKEQAFRFAVQNGFHEYVRNHADEVELNDGDGYSTYLSDAIDEEMEDILISEGAFRSWDSFDGCKLAIETVNWTILSIDDDVQEELFNEYLKQNHISKEDIIEYLETGEEPEDNEDWDSFDVDEMCGSLCVSVKDGEISFKRLSWGDDASDLKELAESLGWDFDFEGDSWKLETTGVYFIE